MNPIYDKVQSIFQQAADENRFSLYEHEVYSILSALEIPVPAHAFIQKEFQPEQIKHITSPKIVLKVVSPFILHKTDVKGVRIVDNHPQTILQTLQSMYAEIPQFFAEWVKEKPHLLPPELNYDISSLNVNPTLLNQLAEQIRASIVGILVCEAVDFEQFGLGSEIMIGVNSSREFGSILTFGPGGTMVEYLNDRMEPGTATVLLSAHDKNMHNQDWLQSKLKGSLAFDILTGNVRGASQRLSEASILKTLSAIQNLVHSFSLFSREQKFVITEFEVNPFVVVHNTLQPLDGLCKFEPIANPKIRKPIEKIKNLLTPESVGIIGVSEKMNMGHIILKNLIDFGFDTKRIHIVKPDSGPIEGCACYPTVKDLPEKVDMFVVTVSAELTPGVVKDLVEYDKAHSAILIAGGIGEKEGSESLEDEMRQAVLQSRNQEDGGLIANGGNCLGIYSHPGLYNTIFIPEYKLPENQEGKRKIAYISQSGAFMITRLSNLQHIPPRFSISTGNQMDLSVTDFMDYLKDDPEVKIFGVYVEGFDDLDGIRFVQLAKEIIQSGRQVVLYKSGRSEEGKTAASGHTASIAGSFEVCDAIMNDAGVIMAYTFPEYEMLIDALVALEEKEFLGTRVGLISNAGFECVGMADNLGSGNFHLKLASFTTETHQALEACFVDSKIDKIVDVHNPLDLTPMASDEAYEKSTQILLDDPNIDAVVVSCVPLTPAMQTLPPSDMHHEDCYAENSFGSRMIRLAQSTKKPFVVVIDSGKIYDPLATMLSNGGIPVFRKSDQALQTLQKVLFYGKQKQQG